MHRMRVRGLPGRDLEHFYEDCGPTPARARDRTDNPRQQLLDEQPDDQHAPTLAVATA